MKRKTGETREKGQATLLVLVALGMFLFAAIGFTLDVSQMYSQRQIAQNAADAAALAGMMSIFDGTNTSNSTFNNTFGALPNGGGNPARLVCGSNDNHTPCYYARQNGFDPAVGDTVYVDFWDQANAFAQEPGVSISTASQDTVPLMRVTIIRPVQATLMRLVGASANNISVQATVAITTSVAPIPILILHPTAAGALSLSGTGSAHQNPGKIQICGGPRRSIQVNSCGGTGGSVATGSGNASCGSGNNSASFSFNGQASIDLSHAGPLDHGDCSTGTGGDFGNFGLPTSNPGNPPLNLGSGSYLDPASPIADPLLGVPTPTSTGLTNQDPTRTTPWCTENANQSTCTDGGGHAVTCPSADMFGTAVSNCVVLKPGIYTSFAKNANPGGLKGNFYIFTPGLYYISSGGMYFDANSSAQTQTLPPSGPAAYPACTNPDTKTGCGSLFFLAANGSNQNSFNVDANAGDIALLGSDPTLSYQKIVVFADHTAVAQGHSFLGGGRWNVTGTVYLTNTIATTLNSSGQSHFQSLTLGGSGGSGTVNGEIIVDELALSGTPGIQMNLDPANQQIRQIALVR